VCSQYSPVCPLPSFFAQRLRPSHFHPSLRLWKRCAPEPCQDSGACKMQEVGLRICSTLWERFLLELLWPTRGYQEVLSLTFLSDRSLLTLIARPTF
jgi:hypothetical protein